MHDQEIARPRVAQNCLTRGVVFYPVFVPAGLCPGGTKATNALSIFNFRVAAFVGVHALACISSLKAVLQRRYPTLIRNRDKALGALLRAFLSAHG